MTLTCRQPITREHACATWWLRGADQVESHERGTKLERNWQTRHVTYWDGGGWVYRCEHPRGTRCEASTA